MQAIGGHAEAERHHPNISFGWGNATVSLQTKKIKGLHENDFIMATKDRSHIRSHGRGMKSSAFPTTCATFSVLSARFDVGPD